MLLTLASCGSEKPADSAEEATTSPTPAQTEQAAAEWTRTGYYQDENENFLSVIYMDDADEPGWYVGGMLGEDPDRGRLGRRDPAGRKCPARCSALPGSRDDLIVTVSEEGGGRHSFRYRGRRDPQLYAA
jgi:hypothetical protein